MITTDDSELAGRMRLFRNHGITRDPKCFSPLTSDLRPLTSDFSWFYEMVDLGYNYRMTDFQCGSLLLHCMNLSFTTPFRF